MDTLSPEREELLMKLRQAWLNAPSLRFGQLLECILDCPRDQCIWEWDTEKIVPKLDKWLMLEAKNYGPDN